jgi:hypothetical protein
MYFSLSEILLFACKREAAPLVNAFEEYSFMNNDINGCIADCITNPLT